MKSTKKIQPKIKKIPNKDLQKLASRIKGLRLKAGYTNYEYFAYEHNIPRSQFGRYEKGEDLRYSSLLRIIKAFGMTLEEFFSEGFEEEKKNKATRATKKKND